MQEILSCCAKSICIFYFFIFVYRKSHYSYVTSLSSFFKSFNSTENLKFKVSYLKFFYRLVIKILWNLQTQNCQKKDSSSFQENSTAAVCIHNYKWILCSGFSHHAVKSYKSCNIIGRKNADKMFFNITASVFFFNKIYNSMIRNICQYYNFF